MALFRTFFLVRPIYDFGWMLGQNDLRLFMRKEDEKPLIEPSNWTLLPQHAYFGCIVISAPQHAEMRNGIRKTWGQLMKPIFIMGLHDVKTLLSVEHESQIYDDIIVEDFVDNYLNLTIKAAYAFGAFLKYFGGSKYFVKADDDIFLSVENLHVLLGTVPEHKLVGNVVSHSKPVRSDRSKWYMPKFLYPWDMYPPYLLGYAVVIPGNILNLPGSLNSFRIHQAISLEAFMRSVCEFLSIQLMMLFFLVMFQRKF